MTRNVKFSGIITKVQPKRRLLSVAVFLLGARASALQPLADFVNSARTEHPLALEAEAMAEQRQSDSDAATWRLLPSFSATGSYTRNQYERSITFPGSSEPEAFIAQDQFDAALVLSVPLINVGLWQNQAATKAMERAAALSAEAVQNQIEQQVARAYFQLIGSAALRIAAEKSLDVSKKNLALVEERSAQGVATQLDVERARADVARVQQDVLVARLAETNAARTLYSLSNIEPEDVSSFPEDDLHREQSLEHFSSMAETSPSVLAAQAAQDAAKKQASASKSVWYPTATGVLQERFSNATALVGHSAFYSLQISLSWKFDGTHLPTTKAQNAVAKATAARALERSRVVQDAVFQAYAQIESGVLSAQAARQQSAAAVKAVVLAQQQYAEGATTQTEVLAAQQASFLAEVAKIRADTDLAYARAALRILSGDVGSSMRTNFTSSSKAER